MMEEVQMFNAVLVSAQATGASMHRVLDATFRTAVSAVALGSGRTALQQVRLPQGIPPGRLSPRARRLIRHAQLSAW